MKSTVNPVPVPPVVPTLVPVAPYVEPPAVIVVVAGVPTATVISTVAPVPVPPTVARPEPVVYPVPPALTVVVVICPSSGVSRVSEVVRRTEGLSRITAAVKVAAS